MKFGLRNILGYAVVSSAGIIWLNERVINPAPALSFDGESTEMSIDIVQSSVLESEKMDAQFKTTDGEAELDSKRFEPGSIMISSKDGKEEISGFPGSLFSSKMVSFYVKQSVPKKSEESEEGVRTFLMPDEENFYLHIHNGPPVLLDFVELGDRENGKICSLRELPIELIDQYKLETNLEDTKYKIPRKKWREFNFDQYAICSEPGKHFYLPSNTLHGRFDTEKVMPGAPIRVFVSPILGSFEVMKQNFSLKNSLTSFFHTPSSITEYFSGYFSTEKTKEERFSDKKRTPEEERTFCKFLMSLIQLFETGGLNYTHTPFYAPFLEYHLKDINVDPGLKSHLALKPSPSNAETLKYLKDHPHSLPQVTIAKGDVHYVSEKPYQLLKDWVATNAALTAAVEETDKNPNFAYKAPGSLAYRNFDENNIKEFLLGNSNLSGQYVLKPDDYSSHLGHATRNGYTEVVEICIKNGAKVYDFYDLIVAAENGHEKTVETILKAGLPGYDMNRAVESAAGHTIETGKKEILNTIITHSLLSQRDVDKDLELITYHLRNHGFSSSRFEIETKNSQEMLGEISKLKESISEAEQKFISNGMEKNQARMSANIEVGKARVSANVEVAKNLEPDTVVQNQGKHGQLRGASSPIQSRD